ncbi:hypothetical protein ACWCQW_54980 [Streptomyces mirabilis]
MSVLGMFYRWAMAEQYATAVPFTYQQAVMLYAETVREVLVNQARRRVPKAHVTIKYLEDGFATTFINGLAGLRPDVSEDEGPGRYRGRHLARNSAMGELVMLSGPRLQEFSYLLVCEVPPLPVAPRLMPIAFPLPEAITKGSKFRVTWTSYSALARVHSYVSLERMLACEGSVWRPPKRWGAPLNGGRGRTPRSSQQRDAATVTARQPRELLRRPITAGQWRAGDPVIAASRPRCEWTTLGDPHGGWATAR